MRTPAADYHPKERVEFSFFASSLLFKGRHTVRKPRARLIPSASALLSAAAMEAYKAATLYSTHIRSNSKEGRPIGASGTSEYGSGKGKWYENDSEIYRVNVSFMYNFFDPMMTALAFDGNFVDKKASWA